MCIMPLVKSLKSGFKPTDNSYDRNVLILRAFALFIAAACTTIGLTMIPSTYYFTLLNMSPFFGSVILFFWTGEKTSFKQIIGMVICFSMVVLLVIYKPNEDEMYGENSIAEPRFGSFTLGFLLVLMAVPFLGFTKASIRATKHIDSIVIMSYQSMVLMPCQIIVIIIYN